MATRNYLDGKDVILFIKRTNATVPETVFKAVACLVSNTFSGSKEKKVINNKCTLGWEDGKVGNGNWQMQGSGQAISDVTSGEVNYKTLAEIWASGEKFEVKMANADGSYYRGGTAMLSEFSETADSEEPLSFDATISGFGPPVMTSPAP